MNRVEIQRPTPRPSPLNFIIERINRNRCYSLSISVYISRQLINKSSEVQTAISDKSPTLISTMEMGTRWSIVTSLPAWLERRKRTDARLSLTRFVSTENSWKTWKLGWGPWHYSVYGRPSPTIKDWPMDQRTDRQSATCIYAKNTSDAGKLMLEKINIHTFIGTDFSPTERLFLSFSS